ncbi:hypothetical protein EYF80_006607 [Liparis tanakae]|uniref:Uncharacterized protein n=1 Tax=Liparis tanakae TaxID=230148 RepID=A0A4Z2IYD8_9TELE|nr:hypothetical protein EYF80_006607 [Liparis tanakae]
MVCVRDSAGAQAEERLRLGGCMAEKQPAQRRAIVTEPPLSHTTACGSSSLGLSSPLSQPMSGRVCLSPVCPPLWQQQGNASALPTAWHHTHPDTSQKPTVIL